MASDEEFRAIGVRYEDGMAAPEVSGRAAGDEAKELVRLAEEAGVYIHEDPVLLSHLDQIADGGQIPREIYTIMAEIISYSYLLQGKFPEMWRRKDGSVAVNKKA